MQSIVFVESNFTGIDAIRSASRAGFKCYLLTADYKQLRSMLPHDIFEAFDSCCEILNVKNSDDENEILETIDKIGTPVAAVITFSQFRIMTVAKVAKRLGLPGTNPDAISVALNKFAVRNVMREAGLPSIGFSDLSHVSEAEDIIGRVGLPCILKPSRGHSSLGIRFIETRDGLQDAITHQKSSSSDLLVEEYLDGPLFSLETVTSSLGKHTAWGYSDRLLTVDFIEMGATFPAVPSDFQAGCDLVFDTLDAIGFDFGTCHTELIFTSRGPRIVEINPRPGGSGICRLVERATEHDVLLDIVEMYTGKMHSSPKLSGKSITMRSILPPASGRIYELPSKTELLRQPGVKDVWFQRKIGDQTDDTRSNFSWLLTLLAESTEGRTSEENADAAARVASERTKIVGATAKTNRNSG